MTVDKDIIREHVETDLGDDAIDRLIADAVRAIEERAGVEDEQTVTLRGGERYIFLPRPIASADDIDSITERWGSTEAELTADDWRWLGGRRLERLVGTGNISPTLWGWGGGWGRDDIDIVVTYTPRADTDRRDRVTIDLVRLAIQYTALSSERAGDYGSAAVEYQKERERLIAELLPRVGIA